MRLPSCSLCALAALALVVPVAGCSSNDDAATPAAVLADAATQSDAEVDGPDMADAADEPTDAAADHPSMDAADAAQEADGSGGPTGTIVAPVRRYTFAFDIDSAQSKSVLTVDVPPPGGDAFAVDCRLSAVDDVTWNGAPAGSHALAQQVLTVHGDGVGAGSTLEVGSGGTVPETTAFGLDVGFSRKTNLAGGEFSYLLSWVEGCDRFGPCDHRAGSLSEFHFDVTHASGTVVLCPGARSQGDTLTTCDITGTLAPTYSGFAIASDPKWVRRDWLSAAGVDIAFYEVPGGKIADSLDTSAVSAFLQWMTGEFGSMPYGAELRVAGAPTAWLGFEHPANIILQQRLPTLAGMPYDNSPLHVLVHEIVHQWAGDRTTLASPQDFVWKEATAEYLTYVFEDEFRPPQEAAASLAYWDTIALQADYHPRPTDTPPPAVNVFYGDAYGPGPMVLFVQLESMLGRATVLQALRSFLADPGTRSVDDLRGSLEQASGQALGPYFDAWVFGAGVPEWPAFAVEVTQAGGEATVTVSQQNASATVFPCVVEVEVQGPSQSARVLVDFGLAPASAVASATAPFSETPTSWTIDPDHRLVGTVASGNKSAEPVKPLRVWIL